MSGKMHLKILSALCVLAITLSLVEAQPIDVATSASARDAIVEIEKQRLVKFPEDVDQQPPPPQRDESTQMSANKNDEAKRILEEIEKINKALGYVKKQSDQPKLPPILDSSQYLFPKPAYQPFHAQHHQFAGSEGQTLLVPSIRAVKLDKLSHINTFNVPPKHAATLSSAAGALKPQALKSAVRSSSSSSSAPVSVSMSATPPKIQYFFRPNEVHVPPPQTAEEAQQLPAHFVIPVRLYKLNKEQYLREHAPSEYRVKGYKIIGDIDSFYGKAKAKQGKNGKSSPKYHLFFLPRELALNDVAAPEQKTQPPTSRPESATSVTSSDNALASREEKLASRPTHSGVSSQSNGQTGVNSNASATSSQGVRKRVGPKPQHKKEAAPLAAQATTPPATTSGGIATTLSSVVKITPPPLGMYNNNNNNNNNMNTGEHLLPNRNRLNPLNPFKLANLTEMQANTSTAIKNAFQNIFKFPFRPSVRPEATTQQQVVLQSVPLQSPQQHHAAAQPVQPIYTVVNNEQDNLDYRWDDEYSHVPVSGASAAGGISANAAPVNDNSDSATEVDDDESSEKHIFGHKAQHMMAHVHGMATQGVAQQSTQKQALREGGIIIQRLKVRKGGIAIAGPGGVATAGSGGTAIVGPGGYALTHPRSLTIAGPGAKVIAIPANVDLKDALQRTNLAERSFPREGKVVATGPTVYYSPPTGDMTTQ